MIVASNTPGVATAYVRLVCALVAVTTGRPCQPTVEVRPVPDEQGRLL